jgi:nucleoside-diphosphate-sugar epimerase
MHLEKRILVTGGAGFLGSHPCDRLIARGVNSEYQLVSKASAAAAGNIVKNSKQSVSSREPQVWAHDWGCQVGNKAQ